MAYVNVTGPALTVLFLPLQTTHKKDRISAKFNTDNSSPKSQNKAKEARNWLQEMRFEANTYFESQLFARAASDCVTHRKRAMQFKGF